MENYIYDLKNLMDVERFQTIQDELSELTKLAIITVDYRGIPITKHSNPRKFCTMIRNDPNGYKMCIKCDSRGGLEAARIKSPYIYLCHCGIVDFAVPIIVHDRYLGAIMAGEVLTDRADELKYIVDKSDLTDFSDRCNDLSNEFPVLPLSTIEKISTTLNNVITYLIEESIVKNTLYETCKSIMQYFEIEVLHLADGSVRKIYKMQNQNIEQMYEVINKISNPDHEIASEIKVASGNFVAHKLIKPALQYIDDNLSANFSISHLAGLCHVSESYFSKLFNNEVGCSLPQYINSLKISTAKRLLSETSNSVTQISNDLGFSDSGYFIKLFKKEVGVTPFAYRKINIHEYEQ